MMPLLSMLSKGLKRIYGSPKPALGFRLGVREQKYECSQNISVRSTFVRYSRSIIAHLPLDPETGS